MATVDPLIGLTARRIPPRIGRVLMPAVDLIVPLLRPEVLGPDGRASMGELDRYAVRVSRVSLRNWG